MSSLYKRQLVTISLVIVMAFIILTVVVMYASRRFVDDEMRLTAHKNARFLGAFTTGYQEKASLTDEYYKGFLGSMALVTDMFIFVTELEGTVSYACDGENFYPIVRNDVSRAVVEELTTQGEYEGVSDLGGIFTEARYLYGVTYSENVEGTGVASGFVLVAPNTEKMDTIWRGVGAIYMVVVLAVLFFTLLLGSYFAAVQVKPLHDVADAARRFGQGELTVRLEGYDNRSDEIGALAKEFNAMATSLAQAESQRTAFISNVSHELKTPMTTISGFAEGILDGTVSLHKREKCLEIILAETRRLSRLVTQMLELSRLDGQEEKVAEEQFDFVEVLAQVIIGMESKILSRNLDIDVQIPEGELLVWGYPDGITQVCYNLLDNATKFASADSIIVVTVSTKDHKAYITVSNEGEPLNKEDLPLLFQRFHKGDYSRSAHKDGLGLGLYIVKSILANLRESITVTSEDGLTQFTFTLSLV